MSVDASTTDAVARGGLLTVHPSRLRENAMRLRAAFGERLIAVVKGDGYGLGIELCAREAIAAGIEVLAVADVAEARHLRAAGIGTRLLILDATDIDDPDPPTNVEWLLDDAHARRLAAGRRRPTAVSVHLDVDLGAGRGGVPYRAADELLMALARRTDVEVGGIAAHLPADPTARLFDEAVARLDGLRRHRPRASIHLGGSDGLRWAQRAPEVAIRVGRPLYGIAPRAVADPGLTQAWAWTARARAYVAPPALGYRGAPPPRGVPVRLDVGFADGLPPGAARRWPLLIDGLPYTIHSVFMLESVAYPSTREELLPGHAGTALLSGDTDHARQPVRAVATAIGAPTTAVLLCPRSRRALHT